jgi:hypothetical protein
MALALSKLLLLTIAIGASLPLNLQITVMTNSSTLVNRNSLNYYISPTRHIHLRISERCTIATAEIAALQPLLDTTRKGWSFGVEAPEGLLYGLSERRVWHGEREGLIGRLRA